MLGTVKSAQKMAYTPAEVAELIGVPEWTVRNAIRKGQIRVVKIGRRQVIPADALDEFLAGTSGAVA